MATAILLVPFLDKAFHIDDTVFIRVARQIEEHPLKPYGFEYNWFYAPTSMWIVTLHPPLHSYLLAVVGMIAGYGEVAMHLFITAIAVGCALLMYALSQRFCRWPALATTLTVLTPAFFVSAGTLMADIPLLFFWLLSTYLAVLSAESGRGWILWAAALTATAAAMTKYFGIAVVPVLAVYWVVRQRSLSPRLLALTLPVVVLVLRGWYSKEQANVFHPLGAAGFSVGHKTFKNLMVNAGVMFSFFGGTLLWPVFLLPAAFKLPKLLWLPFVAGWALVTFIAFRYLDSFENALVFSVFGLAGAFVLASAIESCRARPDADSVLLGLWFFGTVFFTAFVNWTVNARVVLPAALPATLLTLRWLETLESRDFWRRWATFAAWPMLAVSMLVALSDAKFAAAGRDFAQSAVRELIRSGHAVYFVGHWGFQHYMEQEGARPLNVRALVAGKSPMRKGDLLVVPNAAYNTHVIFEGDVRLPDVRIFEQAFRNPYRLVTMSGPDQAGFYSREWGVLPFNMGRSGGGWLEPPVVNEFYVLRMLPIASPGPGSPSNANGNSPGGAPPSGG